MNDLTRQERPVTIDAKGNIVPKPYGVSRWAAPRKRPCTHEDCNNIAVVLRTRPTAHNCCTDHEGEQ